MTDTPQATPAVITRLYKAPIQAVFDAWTDARHLCQWQRPNDQVTCDYLFADIRTGGSALHKMVMPNGHEMWLLTRYLDVSAPNRLVFIQYESNPQGEPLSPSMPNWPPEIQATVLLSETAEGTMMEFRWQPVNPTAEQVAAWEASKGGAIGGWDTGFVQLSDYLTPAR
ncbi:hypothetical protein BGP77_03945 [Saccharospirillum sp. MSK14-1]|uniref:SRPBCC family protein n=1 Tax=Saccharospirillum sp. MSK14-1 TaxID=1897632 RepID=UPI000D4CC413|nr:SRPBCC domain-containing protein [Saccharospirillum sp. MSK14-1]PTY36461.1 hypothetical protein BGP77_03945 [Saccharospirillum sp. MSK14-1]